MNRAPVAMSTITADASSSATSGTQLGGIWLHVARLAWLVLATSSAILFAGSFPAYVSELRTLCTGSNCLTLQLTPERVRAVEQIGLSLNTYAVLVTVDTLAVVAVFWIVAGVLFWRRSDDWLALLVSYMLVASGAALVTGSLNEPNVTLRFLGNLASFLGFAPALFFVFYLFPNGRFVPRWLLWFILVVIGVEAGNSLAPSSRFDVDYWVPNLENLFYFGILAALAGAQIYRYRRFYSPIQRQQSKWVIFSVAVFAVTGLLVFVAAPVLVHVGSLDASLAGVIGRLTFMNVFALLFPVSFAVAIFRYRLWDIDILINRTLVYGSLTAVLAAVYFACVLGAQAVTEKLTGQTKPQPVIVVASTLLIAALFAPLRRRIQATIDRRFYRRKYDAAQALAEFAATVRNEVELSELRERLTSVVVETMQPEHVTLWLRQPESSGR